MAGIAGGRVRRFVGLLTVCFSLAVLLLHTVAVPTRSDAPPLDAAAPPHTHAPARTNRTNRTAPATVEEAILRHCDTVRRVVEEKWLPLARTDPATGDPTVHIALYRPGKTPFPFTGLVEFVRQLVGGGPAHPQPQQRLLITYHRAVYLLRVSQALQATYTAGAGDGRERGWPGNDKAPGAQVLYIVFVSWDAVLHDINMTGFGRTSIGGVETPAGETTWPERVAQYDAHIQKHFTAPLGPIIADWRSGRWRRAPSPFPRQHNVSPFQPPEYVFLVATPHMNCSSWRYAGVPRGEFWNTTQVGGTVRCNAITLPLGTVAWRHLSRVVNAHHGEGLTATAPQRARGGTLIAMLDNNNYLDVCRVSDGLHFDDDDPPCRERLLLAFWGLF